MSIIMFLEKFININKFSLVVNLIGMDNLLSKQFFSNDKYKYI